MAKPLRKKPLYTSSDLARICGADIKTVHTWADKNRIVTFRTPGNHLRIKHEVLTAFLAKYGYPLPDELKDESPDISASPTIDSTPDVRRVSSRDPFHAPECDCMKCERADRRDAGVLEGEIPEEAAR